MAYDERLAERVRQTLKGRSDVTEKQMFGGIAFLVGGRMGIGIQQERLMVRLDPDVADALLREPHVRPMDFTGRPMRGFLYVEAPALAGAAALRGWVERAVEYAAARPAKAAKPARAKAAAGRGAGAKAGPKSPRPRPAATKRKAKR